MAWRMKWAYLKGYDNIYQQKKIFDLGDIELNNEALWTIKEVQLALQSSKQQKTARGCSACIVQSFTIASKQLMNNTGTHKATDLIEVPLTNFVSMTEP